MRHRILIIEASDFHPETRISTYLASEGSHYEVAEWNAVSFDGLRQTDANLIVAVATVPSIRASSFFEWRREHRIGTPTLAIVASEINERDLRAVAETVDDFVLWPLRIHEFRNRVNRILGAHTEVEAARTRLTQELGLTQLIGNDPVFLEAMERIPRMAHSQAPVLISGDTGTGKELCAHAIHTLSLRHKFPFIPVDCAGVPDHLFENEFFGHVRGAYTDAQADQRGLAAMAERGTLFLDEVDALPPGAQANLLRFLQEHTYRPLGSDRFFQSDVKVIAATNRNIEALVDEKQFRADLYFRLNVLRLEIPPLRERRDDIELLARHFLANLSASAEGLAKTISAAALQKLTAYDWPGNVRELSNVMERAFVFSKWNQIVPADICLGDAKVATDTVTGRFREARARNIESFERHYLCELLERHSFNITRAAAESGTDRRALGRLVKKYSLRRQDPPRCASA